MGSTDTERTDTERTDTGREVRIAVVMYGGTSLAIYMNGIAQEFLQLVRATSPHADPAEALSSTARVYRKLAHVLAGTPLEAIDDDVLRAPPSVRFIIDILSGTSAGGINAVMLAKALARNTDLGPLQDLWLREGALDKLINDRQSASLRYPYREPVQSLFNSDRMYVELLKAIERLNGADAPERHALVEELELVVTTTDLTGEAIDLQLADGVAQEYEHKHAFRFRRSPRVDEFTAAHDPLLAFAARSTSSLPAVFEPAVVPWARKLAGKRYANRAPWGLLFRSLREGGAGRELHAFADGGYLDNKPFGHAIDLLAKATGDGAVTRKLYYLEPQPQRIDPDAPPKGIPNALDNTLQVFSLARYETIRADIQRLTDRNRLIDRIRTLGAGVLEDLGTRGASDGSPAAVGAADLSDLVARYGPTYGGYHRLRVATLTDALANTVADHAGVAEGSDVRRALRYVVRAWRNATFRRNRTATHAPESEFLERFDLRFHRRRVGFLLAKVNQLFTLDDPLVGELQHAPDRSVHIAQIVRAYRREDLADVKHAWSAHRDQLQATKMVAQDAVLALTQAGPTPNADAASGSETTTDLDGTLRALMGHVDGKAREGLRDGLLLILEQPTDEESDRVAEHFYRTHEPLIHEVARTLEADIQTRIANAENALSALDHPLARDGLASELADLLRTYRDDYLAFDMVQFPLLEATGIGEELSPVQIHRISPADARQYGRDVTDGKLRGTRFASFGAFLDRRWRQNDIRWGRLDGAERLIASLLGDAPDALRDRLALEAHLAILHDAFPAEAPAAVPAEAPLDVSVTRANIARFLQAKAGDLALDPRASAKDLSRLVRATGTLSDTLSSEAAMPGALRNLVAFTSFAGAGLVDAAIPKSLWRLVTSYWADLLLLFGALLILLDLPFGRGPHVSGALRLGITLAAIAVAFQVARKLVWTALSPPDPTDPSVLPRWTRWFGRAALVLTLLVVAAGAGVRWSGPPGQAGCDVARFLPAEVATSLATSRETLACALGARTTLAAVDPTALATGADTATEPAAATAPETRTASGIDTDTATATPSPVPSTVGRLQVLTILDIAVVLLFSLVLAVAGLLASRGPTRWLGILSVALALATGVAGVWENLRILATLQAVATDGPLPAAWLPFTSSLARIAFLLGFAAVGTLLPTIARYGSGFPFAVRSLRGLVVVAGAAAIVLGVTGLTLDRLPLLAIGLALGVAVLLAMEFLFALGYAAPRQAGAVGGSSARGPAPMS